METARGRWFLGEYAKRNRNADTRMVLDAVARIEETLAAQRAAAPLEDRLAEALAAIGRAVDDAETAASAALDGLGARASLAPIRKGARIIKEISWRWREIGADGRICDLIDSQVGAIEAGCGQASPRPIRDRRAASTAFDKRIERRRIRRFPTIGRSGRRSPSPGRARQRTSRRGDTAQPSAATNSRSRYDDRPSPRVAGARSTMAAASRSHD